MVMDIFNSNSNHFLNSNSIYLEKFLNHYRHFKINSIYLSSEFSSIQTLLKEKKEINPDIITLTEMLSKLASAFVETLNILTIILTLPVSTASNERFFSTLKRVKNYLRLTMRDKRLSDLMVIATEKEEADTLDLNEVVDSFAKLKSGRFPLL